MILESVPLRKKLWRANKEGDGILSVSMPIHWGDIDWQLFLYLMGKEYTYAVEV